MTAITQHTNGFRPILFRLSIPNFAVSNLDASFNPLPPGVTTGCTYTITLGTGTGSVPGGCGSVRLGLYPTDFLKAALAKQKALGPRAIIGDDFQKIGKDLLSLRPDRRFLPGTSMTI